MQGFTLLLSENRGHNKRKWRDGRPFLIEGTSDYIEGKELEIKWLQGEIMTPETLSLSN